MASPAGVPASTLDAHRPPQPGTATLRNTCGEATALDG